jgi:hypothetical protein
MLLLLLLCGCELLNGLMDAWEASGVRNPYRGTDTVRLTLRCQGDARAVLDARLDHLGLGREFAETPTGDLALTVWGAAQREALANLLVAPSDLAFMAVAEDQTPVQPRHDRIEEAALDAVPGSSPEVAFDPDAMNALLEGGEVPLPPVSGVRLEEHRDQQVFAAPLGADWSAWLGGLPLLPGTLTALECFSPGDERLCTPVILEGPAAVTAVDVVGTSLEIDPTHGDPFLELTFGAAGAEALGLLTSGLVGRELGVVAEGQLLSRPRVMEPITVGKARITVGQGPNDEDLPWLWRIDATVASGPLPGPCSIAD